MFRISNMHFTYFVFQNHKHTIQYTFFAFNKKKNISSKIACIFYIDTIQIFIIPFSESRKLCETWFVDLFKKSVNQTTMQIKYKSQKIYIYLQIVELWDIFCNCNLLNISYNKEIIYNKILIIWVPCSSIIRQKSLN